MVHEYKRKTENTYSEETLKQAVLEYKNGNKISLSAVAKKYGIPRTTLQYWQGKDFPEVYCKGRFKPVFTQEMENELKNHIVTLQKMFYGMSPVDIRRLVYEYAVANNVSHPFNTNRKMAGKDWLKKFMIRSHLSLRTPEATSMARVAGFTKAKVDRFFSLLKDVKENHSFPPDRIFNVDETGITCVQRPRKIVAERGVKQLGRITSAERGKNITLLGTISAGGTFIPPILIYPRVRMSPQLLVGSFPGTKGFANPSGWSDANLFVEYLKHFISSVRPSKSRPVLLLLDGHGSHKSLDAINICRKNGITMLTFPPHTSNRLQPLDVAVFGPFKIYLAKEMDKYMTDHPGERITEYFLGPIIKEAFISAFSSKNILKAFEKSGISPYNPDVFGDSDFIGTSAVLSYPVTAESEYFGNTNEASVSFSLPPSTPSQSQAETPSVTKAEKSLKTDTAAANYEEAGSSKDFTENPPSTLPRIKLADISPLPKPKVSKSKSKGRKQEKSEVLTSTPYKDILEEMAVSKEQQVKKAAVKRKINDDNFKSKKQKSKAQKKVTIVERDEETLCLFCNGRYGETSEDWIQCNKCLQWAHEDCSDYVNGTGAFICDSCRD